MHALLKEIAAVPTVRRFGRVARLQMFASQGEMRCLEQIVRLVRPFPGSDPDGVE